MQLLTARAKVERAQSLFDAFAHLETEFARSIGVPAEAIHNIDGSVVFRRRHLPDVPPEAQLIIGDCLQNLRSALEHAVYSLSTAAEPSFERTSFPICATRKAFAKQRVDIQYLDARRQAFIEKVQPFNMSVAEPLRSIPWRLHDLARIDRHRTIPVVLAVVRAESVERLVPATSTVPAAAIDFVVEGGARTGDVLLRLPPTDAHSIAYQPNWDLVITFEESGDWVETDLRAMMGWARAVIAELEHDSPAWPPTVMGWD